MTRIALRRCRQIAFDFLKFLAEREDVEIALVVSSERQREASPGQPSLLECARRRGCPAVLSGSSRDVERELTPTTPDLLYSVYYRHILPAQVLAVPQLGCINVHPGRLPHYRGMTPTAWAILNGETTFGITLHRMDAGIDTGDILFQEVYSIGSDETGHELHVRAMSLGADVLRRTYPQVAGGILTPRPQKGASSYFGRLDPDFVIDWRQDAKRIRNAVRVYAAPYTGARTVIGQIAVRIDRARVLVTV